MRKMLQKIKFLLNIRYYLNKKFKQIEVNARIEQLNALTLNSVKSGINEDKYCDSNIIVSLTTHGKRIHEVYLTIESIMQQSLRPNKIILWLNEDIRQQPLPATLHLLVKRGLEIKYCRDIRSYTKLIPALREFSDDIIITVDDDNLYNLDLVDNLVRSYLSDPTFIYFCRGHKIKLDTAGIPISYRNWEWNMTDVEASALNFPTGVGGVLYPPHIFNDEVFNEEIFLSICKHADDIWFKAMALYNGKLSKRVYTRNEFGEEYLETGNGQDIALGKLNNGQDFNDVQLKAVFDKYNLFNSLD